MQLQVEDLIGEKKIQETVHINFDSRSNLFANILIIPYVLDWQQLRWLGHISPKICLLEPFHRPPLLSDWVRPSLSRLLAWARHFCNVDTALVDARCSSSHLTVSFCTRESPDQRVRWGLLFLLLFEVHVGSGVFGLISLIDLCAIASRWPDWRKIRFMETLYIWFKAHTIYLLSSSLCHERWVLWLDPFSPKIGILITWQQGWGACLL